MSSRIYFTEETTRFLENLKENNTREWFQEHKPEYEKLVKQTFLYFISDFAPRVEQISKQIFVDPRPNGGSMFRIHRDTRFSKDKTPYKTHAAAQFRHIAGKDVHAPGYYFHYEKDNFIFGCGIWRPDSKTLKNIRDAILVRPDEWRGILEDAEFKNTVQLGGDSLVRNPQGIDKDHPLIEDLKRKDFVGFTAVSEELVYSPELMDRFVEFCETTSDLMKFLAQAAGLEW